MGPNQSNRGFLEGLAFWVGDDLDRSRSDVVVLGGLKPLRLSSSGSSEAGAPEEDISDVHGRDSLAEEMSRVLCLWCHGAF